MANRIEIRKKIDFLCLCATVILMWSYSSLALEEDRLWLPRSYQTLYLDLKHAALAAEDLDRCVSVLGGTLDLEQSSKEHPIFRIRCRQENGKTYSEMVDGLTNETLTTPVPIEIALTEEELEQMRLAEIKRKQDEKKARIQRLWEMCSDRFKAKTKLMINLQLLEDNSLTPEQYSDEKASFNINFDAEDASGGKLNYRAICEVKDEQILRFSIVKRPE